MELGLGLDLYFVHLAGIREAERTAQVHPFTGGIEAAFGHGTVADNLDVEILGGNELIGSARHMGLHLTNGQLAA